MPLLFFRFLMFFGFAAFYVAFILVMQTLAAICAPCRAAEMVLVLHLLTVLGFLPALQLKHESTSPIIVGPVAGSTFAVRRRTLESLGGPFAIVGQGLLHVFQLSKSAVTRVKVRLR